MIYLRNLLLGASALAATTTGLHAETLVLASIKPVHSLVAAVMEGTSNTSISSGASRHESAGISRSRQISTAIRNPRKSNVANLLSCVRFQLTGS